MTFQTLTLMATPTVFREVKTYVDGEFVDGVWVEGTVTITYEEIDGFVEPYVRSASSDVLPSGYKSSESLYLFTNTSIVLHNDLPNNQAMGDTIYLTSPDVDPDSVAYLAYDKEPWATNTNFQLITQNYDKVILVRKEKT